MTEATIPGRFAVIVPYYQREPGLLRRCVESIAEQRGVERVDTFVVDDSSPHPAGEELAGMKSRTGEITIIRQENSGPGSARNRGLEAVCTDTDYVAFIDSDDAWRPDFLATASTAFASGADVFFANTERINSVGTRFEWGQDENNFLAPERHETLDAARLVYAYRGDFFSSAVEKTGMISTSTLAYRFTKHTGLRFNTTLFNGQDRLFKLELSHAARKVAFTPRVLAFEGAGVNIFDNSQWGSPSSLRLLNSYINLAKTTRSTLPLSADQESTVIRQLNEVRLSFLASLLHLLRKRGRIDWQLVYSTIREDPRLLLQAPKCISNYIRRAT